MSKSRTITDGGTVAIKLPPIHPGLHLRDEMDAMDLSINALARALDVPTNRISLILNGKRSITADTALRLSLYFGTTAEFWMNLQQTYDLAIHRRDHGEEIARAVRPVAA